MAMTTIAAAVSIVLILLLCVHGGSGDFADCGGCFCIPEGSNDCPPDNQKPETDFSGIIPNLREMQLTKSKSLECDPYDEDISCPRFSEDTTGVCVVEIVKPGNNSRCPTAHTYSLVTIRDETLQEALDKNRYVTHDTPCGYCSSLQDLSVYMEQGPNLLSAATRCGLQGLFSQSLAIRCFEGLGFTESCATMWYYNTRNTRDFCFGTCVRYTLFGGDPNEDAPTCDLVDCVECDEFNSGEEFNDYAGRTRRNSGLLSNIARPCSATVPLPQPDPCSTLLT